jgi:hypothetical protein
MPCRRENTLHEALSIGVPSPAPGTLRIRS